MGWSSATKTVGRDTSGTCIENGRGPGGFVRRASASARQAGHRCLPAGRSTRIPLLRSRPMGARLSRRLAGVAFALVLALPSAAAANGLEDPLNQWLPSPDDASWTYDWTDSAYATENTRGQY